MAIGSAVQKGHYVPGRLRHGTSGFAPPERASIAVGAAPRGTISGARELNRYGRRAGMPRTLFTNAQSLMAAANRLFRVKF